MTAAAGSLRYRVTPQGFVDQDGAVAAFLELPSAAGTEDWDARQRRSMPEYLAHGGAPPQGMEEFYALFDAYVAAETYTGLPLKLLDIGCGIGTQPPLYAATIVKHGSGGKRIYVGLDPLRHNISGRSYPFVCGRVEDLPQFLDDKFDVFLFSTSLDHFEDIEAVAAAVKRLASKDAQCLFWLGLHDISAVAEQSAPRFFRKLFGSLSPLRFFLEYCASQPKLLRIYWNLRRRRRRLAAGEPIDALHYHYFTAANVSHFLKLFGRVTRELRVPGSNMLFATVALEVPA